ncbi:imm11 family protein [Sphingomonas sp. LM7]|uniref:imm11 family protein n=1 Tax=Sphingomonas sp. LM7 TaxID=1938607 RepID=UPI0012374ED9|nr:DUF1629 domain-containing protein [Sphingomonas sp. LM7]
MAYRFTARAIQGVFSRGSRDSYETTAGSFTIIPWPDGTSRFGAPTEIAWLTDIERLPDLVKLPYLCISARVRDVIERLEPGRHAFYPVRVTLPNGSSEARFFLHVTQTFDAVSAEHSDWIKSSGVLWRQTGGRAQRLVFDARMIGEAHLWINGGLRTESHYLASDRLAEAARAAGFTGLLLDHYDQTDLDGAYVPPPLADAVYVVSEQTRVTSSGVPVKIKLKILDGKAGAVRFADDPGGTPSLLAGAVRHGRRLDPATVPTRAFYWQQTKGNAPDFFSYSDLPPTVSTRLKQLIEQFEPGVHQFLPIAFVGKQGAVTEERHILVLGARLDTGSRPHSTMLSDPPWYNPGGEQGRIVIDRAAVAGRHAWRDQWLAGDLFVSEALAAAIEERGWPHFGFGRYELVD